MFVGIVDKKGSEKEIFRHLCTAKSVQHLDNPREARLAVTMNFKKKKKKKAVL